RAEAESYPKLLLMVSEQLIKLLGTQRMLNGVSLGDAAEKVLSIYRNTRAMKNRRISRRTSLEAKGVEIDVISCYLRGQTARSTLAWLKKEKGVYSSKAAVGRFRKGLFDLNIRPLK
ncbi:unnamed protein product, partial [marine sediment metagenome]